MHNARHSFTHHLSARNKAARRCERLTLTVKQAGTVAYYLSDQHSHASHEDRFAPSNTNSSYLVCLLKKFYWHGYATTHEPT